MNRRQLLRLGLWTAAASAMGLASPAGGQEPTSPTPSSVPSPASTDDALLDEIERAAFRYFWEQASPRAGLVKDRARASGRDDFTVASIAATGFGLTALCIGDMRRYAPAAEIAERVETTLRFVAERLEGVRGFHYHFVDMHLGRRVWNCELSSIDTALLMCGVLTARQHLAGNEVVRRLATQIYERVDWPWMLNGADTLSMGWHPETGFITSRWKQYCELMMLLLLGLGSPTHPLPPSTWQAWKRPKVRFAGLEYISGDPCLFTHQYSHAWFDFRHRRDEHADYFQNSVTATRAHKLFCLSLHSRFPSYTEDLWGVSASDSAHGYVAWGGPPAAGPLDGTVVPCAAGGSIPFLPADTIRVLRTIREKHGERAWGRYGFVDAFHPLRKWTNPDVLGIDVGITMLMAENHRTGYVWQTFMRDPCMQRAMERAGLRPTHGWHVFIVPGGMHGDDARVLDAGLPQDAPRPSSSRTP